MGVVGHAVVEECVVGGVCYGYGCFEFVGDVVCEVGFYFVEFLLLFD